MIKMTAAEYLKSRGWLLLEAGDWCDTVTARLGTIAQCLAIQRARDAVEERAAWVAFAAGTARTGSVADADLFLHSYRARFGVEIVV